MGKRREEKRRGGDRKVHVCMNVRGLGRRGREREREIGGRGEGMYVRARGGNECDSVREGRISRGTIIIKNLSR